MDAISVGGARGPRARAKVFRLGSERDFLATSENGPVANVVVRGVWTRLACRGGRHRLLKSRKSRQAPHFGHPKQEDSGLSCDLLLYCRGNPRSVARTSCPRLQLLRGPSQRDSVWREPYAELFQSH